MQPGLGYLIRSVQYNFSQMSKFREIWQHWPDGTKSRHSAKVPFALCFIRAFVVILAKYKVDHANVSQMSNFTSMCQCAMDVKIHKGHFLSIELPELTLGSSKRNEKFCTHPLVSFLRNLVKIFLYFFSPPEHKKVHTFVVLKYGAIKLAKHCPSQHCRYRVIEAEHS